MIDLKNIKINNNVSIKNLKNNYTWIHGKSKENILYTIFLITINGSQLSYCLDSINNLNLDIPCLVNVIMDISPTNKAYNQMRVRCNTDYFIQLDEDMILFNNALEIINKNNNTRNKYFLNIYRLKDYYLGVGEDKILYGLKIYDQNIMKKFPTKDEGNTAVSAVDRLWHVLPRENGYVAKSHRIIIGYHELHRNNFDLFLKYSKITNNLLSKEIIGAGKIKDDLCRLLIPLNKLNNSNYFFYMLINNFICNKFQINDNFKKYFKKIHYLLKTYFNNVSKHLKNMYLIENGKVNLELSLDKLNFNAEIFFKNIRYFTKEEISHLYSLAGIINMLFNNYKYSFNTYPMYINNYFNKIFYKKKNVLIISSNINGFGGSATNALALYKYFKNKYNCLNLNLLYFDYINLIEKNNITLKNTKNIKYIKKKKFDDNDLFKIIQNLFGQIDLIIFRYPQCDFIQKFNLENLKKNNIKIISIFGGGFRTINSRKVEEIKKSIKNKMDDLSIFYDKNKNIFSKNEIDNQSKKYINITNNSDIIVSNNLLYSMNFKQLYKDKFKGSFYFSSINSKSGIFSIEHNSEKFFKKKYDIIFIASSLKRTVKNFPKFLKIIENYKDKNILIIGKNFLNYEKFINHKNIEYIPHCRNINEILINSKVIVLTSYYEACPNILFEALHCNCNVVLSKNIGGYELIENKYVINNYKDNLEWKSKIDLCLTNRFIQINKSKINEINNNLNYFDNLLLNLLNIDQNNCNIKKTLIITFLEEYITKPRLHYSKVKGYLLNDSLLEQNHITFILTNQIENIEYNDKYFYINYKILTPNIIANFDYIFFVLHNKEYLEPLYENTNIFNNIIEAKKINKNLKVINKTCTYPSTIDSFKNINTYDFFDKIFLQTSKIQIPKKILSRFIKNYDNKYYNIDEFSEYCKNNNILNKFYYSEMTVPKKIIFDSNKSNLVLDKNKINILYMGRLNSSNGMNIIFLIKLMKKLGEKYKLYIIPGSFKLPTEYPTVKHSPKNNEEKYLLIKNFIEKYQLDYNKKNIIKRWREQNLFDEINDCKKCNIEVLPLMTYGEHFNTVCKFDIGIGFAESKGKNVGQASAKLYDYMYCNIKIVVENGWENCYKVKKYLYGEVLSNNSTVEEFANSIKKVSLIDKKSILYDDFLIENNYTSRIKDILKKI